MSGFGVFIRRPVFATMLTALLVVLGTFSYRDLGVDLYPNIELPVVTVTTNLKGASPEEIETQVTKPIEEMVNTVSGIEELRSVSLEGVSVITVTFALERKLADAAQDVRDKVATVLRLLPEGTDPPVVQKFDVESLATISLAVSGSRDLRDVTEIADKQIRPALETVDGVGAVLLVGGTKRAVNVWLDAERMDAYRISSAQVKAALQAENVEIPGGRVDRGRAEQVLRTMGRIEKVSDFNKLIVANMGGFPVTIGHLGVARDGIEEPRTLARLWTREGSGEEPRLAVSLLIRKQSGTNTVKVVDRVKQRLEHIRSTLPRDIRIEVVSDQSVFVRASIGEVQLHLVLGALLASLVVLVFMRDWRSTIIAAVAIPASIVATFTLMRGMGFTLNNMTMLGLTLAVGVVIDDAIVVLENIFRHMEELKKKPLTAALEGLTEIALAVLATTFSLVVIFLPVAFMSGQVGRLFYSYGITVAFSILISLLISFTLTPMLSSRFLKIREGHAQSRANWFYRGIDKSYGWLLRGSLNNRFLTVGLSLLMVAAAWPLYQVLGKDFLPPDDRSEFQLTVQTPEGSSLAGTDRYFQRVEQALRGLPEVRTVLTTIGDTESGSEDVTKGTIYVGLVPHGQRQRDQLAVMQEVRRRLSALSGIQVAVNEIGDIWGSRFQYAVNLDLQGPDLATLQAHSDVLMERMRRTGRYVDVDSSLSKRKPEVRVEILRQKAADLGVQAGDIANSLRAMVGGEKVSRYREGAEQYDVWIRLQEKHRRSKEVIAKLPVPSSRGGVVSLENVADLAETRAPLQIDHLNRQRVVTIVANLQGLDLGRAIDELRSFAADLRMEPGYGVSFSGRGKLFAETGQNFAIAFFLSFIFMYMILASQFESFLHPITIMLSLPLSVPFSFLSLYLLRDTLNVYSILGLFMLFGIVKKNGILQIDYTNTLVARGMERGAAILEANHARLRPILMTTVTLIAGMIPIAFGTGPGAASRASMANVIIGGQALSLVISLLIVPVAYSLFEDARDWRRRRAERRAAARAAEVG
jgi:HAE1 family hydrophobic/amphiphilic exporter-1